MTVPRSGPTYRPSFHPTSPPAKSPKGAAVTAANQAALGILMNRAVCRPASFFERLTLIQVIDPLAPRQYLKISDLSRASTLSKIELFFWKVFQGGVKKSLVLSRIKPMTPVRPSHPPARPVVPSAPVAVLAPPVSPGVTKVTLKLDVRIESSCEVARLEIAEREGAFPKTSHDRYRGKAQSMGIW